jgi:hypothetical protein
MSVLMFEKDVPISGLDIFDLKDLTFGQVIPENSNQCSMRITNGVMTINNQPVGNFGNLRLNCDVILNVYQEPKGQVFHVTDVLFKNGVLYSKTCLNDRMLVLEKIVANLRSLKTESEFKFCRPENLVDIKETCGVKIRLVKDRPLDLCVIPSMVYGRTTCNLKSDGAGRLCTDTGRQVLKKQSTDGLPVGVIKITLVGKKVTFVSDTDEPVDTYERFKKCLFSLLCPTTYADILHFQRYKQIPTDSIFLNKNEIGVLNTLNTKSPFIKYTPYIFASLDTTMSPDLINKLSIVYEMYLIKLTNLMHSRFPKIAADDIKKRIQSCESKFNKVDYILGHNGCIICGEDNVIYNCKECHQIVLCKSCVTAVNTKHQFDCKFCGTKTKLSNKDMYESGVPNEYDIKDIPLKDLIPETTDNEIVYASEIENVHTVYKQWINSVSMFKIKNEYRCDCEVNVYFGNSHMHNFETLLLRYPYEMYTYRVGTNPKDNTVKRVFDLNCNSVSRSTVAIPEHSSYKKNKIRTVREIKYGLKISLNYTETIPCNLRGSKIKGETIVYVEEYIHKLNKDWNLVLKKVGDRHEISLNSKGDSGVNAALHELIGVIY